MNIPDEGFFTLLTQGMRNRTVETLQRALYHTLRDAILQGTLTARCRLPGSRVMAERLHLSRNTVNAALEQLALEGYLTRSRQGTQVAPLASCRQEAGQMPPVVLPERLQRLPAAMRRDSPTLAFTPGMPAVNYFPLPLWRRLMDKALRDEGSTLLGYGEAAGDPQLREAIARHLALSRGIRCDIRQIVITEGALEGVNLCASLLTNPGDSVWLEEPGYLGARSGFQRAGLRVRGMAVDDEGMCIANGVAEPPRLIFTSPSHQYPCGSIMSAGRRLALVEYARRHGAWIVEDDYDSEFRHSGEPIPAMLGMVPDAPVVYLGTFSKTLFPALRIGFMVMPPALADAAQDAIGALLRGGHRAEQRALASFIEKGHYARHLAAMRKPLIEANDGRCFMLCTSHAMMRDLAEQFRATMTLPVLLQGETSKGQLLQQFVSAGNALLVATSSFWEGVDVRGDTLSLVIIDKLPFTSPDDPLLKARMEDCRLRGGDPFEDVQLPDAVITLKQGVGRLIRDADDRGVLVICDNRLVMRPYGATFLASLPPAPRTRDIARAVRFLAIPTTE